MRVTGVYVICCRGQPMSRAAQRLIGEVCSFSDVYDGSCRRLSGLQAVYGCLPRQASILLQLW